MSSIQLPELLAPAGGKEQLEAALLYGADAVYLGGKEFSLRAKSHGFTFDELRYAVDLTHQHGKKLYYCVNAFPYQHQIESVRIQLEQCALLRPDALIAADPGVINLARKTCPEIPLHLSTQAHSVNSEAVSFWKSIGISRINLARELNADDIRSIMRECPDMEFEIFVHGAMCLSLSGHCLISDWANSRPANLGLCTQPCRFEYRGMKLTVEEKKRPSMPFLEISQDEDFSAVWAPMDLCLARYLPDIAKLGPACLKIEGRTKSGGYVASVTDIYRTALDGIKNGEDSGMEKYVTNLLESSSRPLCSGFYLPTRQVEHRDSDRRKSIVARIENAAENGKMLISVKSIWLSGQSIYLMHPGMKYQFIPGTEYSLETTDGRKTGRLNPGMQGVVHFFADISADYGMYLFSYEG